MKLYLGCAQSRFDCVMSEVGSDMHSFAQINKKQVVASSSINALAQLVPTYDRSHISDDERN